MGAGVLIITHYKLGEEMLQALRQIVPHAPRFHCVGIDPVQGVEEIRRAVAAGLDAADGGDGVLALTDMFGGTPSNIALSFLGGRRLEVVTGLNLPMLIKLATQKEAPPLEELAALLKETGRRNITVAGALLADAET